MSRASAKYSIEAQDNTAAGLNSVRRNFRSATQSFRSMAGQVAALAGIGGFGLLVKQAIDAGDRIDKLSRQTGNSAEFLSQLRHSAELAGTSMESVARATIRIQRATAQALDGEKTYSDAFAALGINVKRFAGLNADEQFLALAEATRNATDQVTLMSAGSDIAGRSFAELIPLLQGGAEELKKTNAEAASLGLTLSALQAEQLAKANDAMTRFKASSQGLAQTFAVEAAPQIAQFANFLSGTLRPVLAAVIKAFDQFSIAVSFNIEGVVNLLNGEFKQAMVSFKRAFTEVAKVPDRASSAFSRVRSEIAQTADAASIAGTKISEALTKPVAAGAHTTEERIKALTSFIRRFVIPDLRAQDKLSSTGVGGTAEQVSRSRFALTNLAQTPQKRTNKLLEETTALLKRIELNTAREHLNAVLA